MFSIDKFMEEEWPFVDNHAFVVISQFEAVETTTKVVALVNEKEVINTWLSFFEVISRAL